MLTSSRSCWLAAVGFLVLPPVATVVRAADKPPAAEPQIEFGAVLRGRAESRVGAGANAAQEDTFALSRLRLDMTFRPSQTVKVFIQGQDSRIAGLAAGRSSAGFRSPLDLRQAYVSVGKEDGPWTLHLGRREINLLDRRLVGIREWANIVPTWDGATLALRRGADSVQLFGFSRAGGQEGFDSISPSHFVYGAVASFGSWAKGQTIEPFFLTTRRPVDRRSHLGGLLRTTGSRFTGKFSRSWDYQVILAAQGGGERGRPHRAWMGVWGLGRTFEAARTRPRVGVEWTHASGDRDPTDGRIGTFDALFLARHRILGEQDVTVPRNLQAIKSGIQLHARRNLQLNLDYYGFRLASLRDGVYRTSLGLGIAAPPGGARSRYIGSELDLVVRYAPVRRLDLRLGLSRFFTGDFVTRNLPEGGSQTYFYSALQLRL